MVLRTIAQWRESRNRKLNATKTPVRAVMKFKNLGTISKIMKNENMVFRNIIPNPRRGLHIINPNIGRVTHLIQRNKNTGNFSVKNLETKRVMKFQKGTPSLERKWREFFGSRM
jgi:hypothetical protein